MDLFLNLLAILGGIAMLVWGADRFVEGAASTARRLNVSALMIGLTIISLGTSAPEILVAIEAAMNGETGLAIGNAVGSNITNITLILGVTALIIPLTVKARIVRIELPILLLITAATILMLSDLSLDRIDGVILLGGMMLLVIFMVFYAKRGHADEMDIDDEMIHEEWTTKQSVFWLLLGLAILLGGSKLVVWGAVEVATVFGISKVVIGLTIVAIGTSLPELAASVTGALKGEHDIAIGNVVGSNMYNLLMVLGIAALIQPGGLDSVTFNRDVLVMGALTSLLLVFAITKKVNRFSGGVLLGLFVAYQVTIYLSESNLI